MKKTALAVAMVAVFALVACEAKSPGGKAPQNTQQAPGNPSISNPHADLKSQASKDTARFDHKGKVVSTMNAAGYTFVEAEENGARLWVAVMETKIKAGDKVEFPDIPPMVNFHSNSLNRTFEKIIFSDVIAVNGKIQAAVAGPPRGAASQEPQAGLKARGVQTPAGMTGQPGSPAANPHGRQAIEAGEVHKGKVVTTMNAAGYTYMEVEENGARIWVAVMETKVKAGDTVEFPDGMLMQNFRSNSLNRTFPKIIFSSGVRVNGKLQKV